MTVRLYNDDTAETLTLTGEDLELRVKNALEPVFHEANYLEVNLGDLLRLVGTTAFIMYVRFKTTRRGKRPLR